eukprot:scaffold102555_cov44-Cyclotella_meneghiniana.AAC.1
MAEAERTCHLDTWIRVAVKFSQADAYGHTYTNTDRTRVFMVRDALCENRTLSFYGEQNVATKKL